jgi:hypothetical protein
MIKGADSVLPFAVLREGVGGRPMVLGWKNAAACATTKGYWNAGIKTSDLAY